MTTKIKTSLLIATVAFFGISATAFAEDTYTMEMKDGAFSPAKLEVPANKKIHLIVNNHESGTVEFESYELDQEQKISSGESINLDIGPLEPGEYPVFDDKNESAKGAIVAK